jgi:predicted nucleotidyltransferase
MTYFPARNILTMRFGSHLYGTNTPVSDMDYKSLFVPSGRDILLGRVQDTIVKNTKSDNESKNSADDIDDEAFSLQKYLKLLSQGQTVALDMLFAPDDMIVAKNPSLFWVWKTIRENKHRLITKKSQSFVGYCRQQANKYGIKGSRVKEAEIAKLFFENKLKDFHAVTPVATFHDELTQLVSEASHSEIVEIPNPNGMIIKHFSCAGRKVPYTVSLKEAINIYRNLYDKYGERARKAKNNDSIDWKAMSHAVRVGTQAIELAQTGNITFPLPNKEYVLEVKQGERRFDEVSEYITDLLDQVEKTFAESSLSEEPDYEWIDALVVHVYHDQFKTCPSQNIS